MKRYNNAPPPESPWRLEVLEAKRAAEKAMEASRKANQGERDRSNSKSRSRSRSAGKRKEKEKKKEDGLSQRKAADVAAEKGLLLRNVQERGEGFYAAVARASREWESVSSKKRPQVPEFAGKSGQTDGKKPEKEAKRKKEKRHDDDDGEMSAARRRQKDLDERRAREEYEAKAEERLQKADQEKKKAEEERQKLNDMKNQRKNKLKGAFAMEEEDDDDKEREAAAVRAAARKAAERKRQDASSTDIVYQAPAAGNQAALALGLRPSDIDEGKGGAVDPAVAFMKLQERKRKGRSTEFGGPPRGCSPWRDGRKGITFEEKSERR